LSYSPDKDDIIANELSSMIRGTKVGFIIDSLPNFTLISIPKHIIVLRELAVDPTHKVNMPTHIG
jgi:hypothetical protein